MTVKEFLNSHGQGVEQVDVKACLSAFAAEAKKGLGGVSSIPMIPTYLMNVDRSLIKTGVKRILIDAGGTNFRAAVGYFDDLGEARIENVTKTVMPASDGKALCKEAFYGAIAENVREYLPAARDVGFCFSYQVEMDKDVDGKIVMFSKEIKAPEVIGTRVGFETLKALKRYDSKARRIVVLNDTVATLLGGMAYSDKKYSAYLGYIYGTGTNVCYIENTANITKVKGLPSGEMIINTECGNFEGFVRGDFDNACIARTAVPDKQIFEKMTSGKYLADIIAEAFFVAKAENRFSGEVILAPFELKDVSSFLEGGSFPCKFDTLCDLQFAKDICTCLIERAAKMGAVVNSALAILSCKDKSLPVAIVAEGTTFNKLTNYKTLFKSYLDSILGERGVSYEIIQGGELNFVGALMASMTLS